MLIYFMMNMDVICRALLHEKYMHYMPKKAGTR